MASLPALTAFAMNGSSMLPPRQVMVAGQYLTSPGNKYKLVLQADGNLVIQDVATSAIVWVADATQPYSSTLAPDGNPLSLYVSNNMFLSDPSRHRLWVTTNGLYKDTGLWLRSHLSLQDDGNLVILDITALYTTLKTTLLPNAQNVRVIAPGTALEVGKAYVSGAYSLVFQADGNLVIFNQAGAAIWNAGTAGKGATQAVMQADGNFVISNAAGQILWSTGTAGKAGAYAQLQSNGALVICYGTPTWARFGFVPNTTPPKVIYPDDGHSISWSWSF